MISALLNGAIEKQARELLTDSGLEWSVEWEIRVERPARPEHGEYSTNTAMLLARTARTSPLQLASELKRRLEREESLQGLFRKIEAVPPGFLNFYMDWRVWAARKPELSDSSEASNGKIVIEHTSINPNKAAHIGHLRNSCIGDTLARMLAFAGNRVEVHNYIDDLGNQLADTVVGMLHTPAEASYSRFGDFCWDTYARVNEAFKPHPELQEERTRVLHALEEGRGHYAWIGALAAERIVREQLEEMKAFGITYDVLVWESSIVREGFWASAFELLKQTSVFRKETEGKLAGCWVLRPEDSADAGEAADYNADNVLVRSNGILTYTAKDIAYHLWKFGLLPNDFTYKKISEGLWSTATEGVRKPIGKAEQVINVIDRRQEYPQRMVKLALEALGYKEQAERLKHVGYGVVSLSSETASGLGVDVSDGRGAYPMSGRQGIGSRSRSCWTGWKP